MYRLILTLLLMSTTINCQYSVIPDRKDYANDYRPEDPKTARSILGYSIYDKKPVSSMKTIDFEDHWRHIADRELNPEFYGYKFGDRIK